MTTGSVSIVCAYPDGMLDTAWFRAYKRVKRSARRASLNVQVELRPFSSIDERADVVFVTPEVAAQDLPRLFDEALERLKGEGRVANVPSPSQRLVKHRGYEPVDTRARIAE